MEKLHELHEEGGYDLIVVDTPPTRHALDFLDAPKRITSLLDNRIFRVLMTPTKAGMRVAGVALQTFLRTVGRVVGTAVIDDVVAFFRAFEGMEDGFRERAATVLALLADPGTRFVLVTAPQRDAVDEAVYFADRDRRSRARRRRARSSTVCTRSSATSTRPACAPAPSTSLGESRDGEAKAAAVRLATHYENLADFQEISIREHLHLDAVRARIGTAGGRDRPVPRPRRPRLHRPRRDRRAALRREPMNREP